MSDTTYKRKYYLIREVKKAGYELVKCGDNRIINVPWDKQNAARRNKYLQELRTKYQFGVQTIL